jgi:thiazole/oxazole-forming peptide maturase SagC family component
VEKSLLPTYPKTKTVMLPYKLGKDKIRFGGFQYKLAREITTDHRDLIWDLLVFMDGSKHLSDVINYFKKQYSLETEDVKYLVAALQKGGFIEEQIPNGFTQEEIERYDRNVKLFSWLDKTERTNHWELQNKIRQSKIGVIGLGGVGSNCALSLSRLGVGQLTIVDFDKVEITNLNRQALYNKSHVGHLKVDAAAEELSKVNELTKIIPINKFIEDISDVEEIIQDVDMLVLCADQPRIIINRIVNRAAQKLQTPWILASYANTVVNCALMVPGKTPCWECLYLKQMQDPEFVNILKAEEIWGVQNAVTAPVAALTANLAVQEVMAFLTGLKSPEAPSMIQFDLYTMDKQDIKREFISDCPVCKNPYQPLEFEKELNKNG